LSQILLRVKKRFTYDVIQKQMCHSNIKKRKNFHCKSIFFYIKTHRSILTHLRKVPQSYCSTTCYSENVQAEMDNKRKLLTHLMTY